jgi:hypothetical protein
MKRLVAVILVTMVVLAACDTTEAPDVYDTEGIVSQEAMNLIKVSNDCAYLQETFDRNFQLTVTSSAGTAVHKRGLKFMEASDARMKEAGCYE